MYGPMLHDPLFGPAASALGFGAVAFSVFLAVVALWSLVWKAIALWHAARSKQRYWFLALLIVNTVGVLEIVYLAWFRKDENALGKTAHLFPFIAKMEERVRADSSAAPEEKERKVEESEK